MRCASNWYPLATDTAQRVALPSGLEISLIRAPEFIATKLEAFAGRGNNDYLFSHDMGDLIAVIDGRAALQDECSASDDALKAYLRDWFTRLLARAAFMEALAGHLPGDAASQERLPELESKMRALAQLV